MTLAGLTLAVTIGYTLACWIWPFRACRRCHGLGKRRSPSGRTFRYCRSCKGSGAKLRAGRWIYNHLSSTRRDAR
jgi:DnaJ-class molecular chaperone